MKYYFFLICFLSFCCHSSANGDDPFAEGAENMPCPPIKPERGFPDLVPYVKTGLSIVSIHLPIIENPPTPLSEMAKVENVDAELPHTSVRDEMYDVTKWFPLHKMRGSDEKEADDKRWVYYNVTSGYVIANADHFLQSSVYDFIHNSIMRDAMGLRTKVDVIYLETGDRVATDLKSIQQVAHRVIFRTSNLMRTYDRSHFKTGGIELSYEVILSDGWEQSEMSISYKNNEGELLESRIRIPVSKWVVFECGLSEAGLKKLMFIKIDFVNHNEQVLYLQSDKDQFMRHKAVGGGEDPFGGCVDEFYKIYRVAPDIVDVLSGNHSSEDFDPFGEHTEEGVNVSEVLAKNGVRAKAFFIQAVGCIVAYADKTSHEYLTELLTEMLGGRPLALKCNLYFYEIDVPGYDKQVEWTEIDLLAGNPKKIASLGVMVAGARALLVSDKSECGIQLIRDESGEMAEYWLDLKIDLPLLKLEEEFNGKVRFDAPNVISLGVNPKTNRMIMMLMQCSEIESETTIN